MTSTRSPLASESAAWAARSRQAVMRKNRCRRRFQLVAVLTRAVTARRKLPTAAPLGVKRDLGVVGQVADRW